MGRLPRRRRAAVTGDAGFVQKMPSRNYEEERTAGSQHITDRPLPSIREADLADRRASRRTTSACPASSRATLVARGIDHPAAVATRFSNASLRPRLAAIPTDHPRPGRRGRRLMRPPSARRSASSCSATSTSTASRPPPCSPAACVPSAPARTPSSRVRFEEGYGIDRGRLRARPRLSPDCHRHGGLRHRLQGRGAADIRGGGREA
ncbi:MAG: hypothetical protein ACLTDR_15375 [Adlercreutzia equolifaciens]